MVIYISAYRKEKDHSILYFNEHEEPCSEIADIFKDL